jgi:glycopeptide antibiotics resistance protein
MLLVGHDRLFGTVTGVVLVALLLLPLLPLAVRVIAAGRSRRGADARSAWRSSVIDLALLYGTAFPVWLTMLPGGGRELSLVPFRDLATMPTYQVVGNLLLLSVPAFGLPLRFPRAATVPRVVLVAMALSCTIETCQYVLPIGRVASVDDVLLNTAGAACAALTARAWSALSGLLDADPDRRLGAT